MSSFPSAMITKKKKSKDFGAKKVNPAGLKGVEEIEIKPLEKSIELESDDMEETAKKVKPSPVPTANKVKAPEDSMSIDLFLNSAKKKPEVNATSSEGEDFKVEKDKKGMWKESGASKEKYLKAIGKLKKGK